jgi:hypothetical protein
MFKDAFVKAYHPRLIKFLALVSRLRKVLFFPMKQGIMSNKILNPMQKQMYKPNKYKNKIKSISYKIKF